MAAAAPRPANEPVVAHVCGDCDAAVGPAAAACTACGAPRPRGGWSLDAHVGRLLGDRYRLLERIGAGGVGTVYRAADASADGDLGPVVVKLLGSPPEGRERRRFTNEARVARSLSSPHAVKVYDFGIDDGRPYLVMELLVGQTLRQVLRAHGALPVSRAIDVGLAVCEAIDEAHRRGVVHRDLKPENLMLLAPDHTFVKVLDFGAAGGMVGPEVTRSVVGTPRYMAPEQIQEEEIDGRVDVYALGVCLYEMLTGKVPFARDSAVETMNAHLHDAVPTLARDDCPEALRGLVLEMLAKERDGRPASLREVAERLRAAVGTGGRATAHMTPATAAEASAMAPSASRATSAAPAGWSRRTVAAVVLASVATTAVVGLSTWRAEPGPEVATPAAEIDDAPGARPAPGSITAPNDPATPPASLPAPTISAAAPAAAATSSTAVTPTARTPTTSTTAQAGPAAPSPPKTATNTRPAGSARANPSGAAASPSTATAAPRAGTLDEKDF